MLNFLGLDDTFIAGAVAMFTAGSYLLLALLAINARHQRRKGR